MAIKSGVRAVEADRARVVQAASLNGASSGLGLHAHAAQDWVCGLDGLAPRGDGEEARGKALGRWGTPGADQVIGAANGGGAEGATASPGLRAVHCLEGHPMLTGVVK